MNTTTPQRSTSFRHWSQGKTLAECLALSEAHVRRTPRDPRPRWLLIELLCVLAQWERALRQLQTWAATEPGAQQTAQLMRGLIRAEYQRAAVLDGQQDFASIASAQSTSHAWMKGLWQALVPNSADGQPEEMAARDALRSAALAQAPDTRGRCDRLAASFDWITDTDTRLGPVCEVVLMGSYRWIAIDDLRSLRKDAPGSLLDLVWSPVRLELRDGTPLQGFMPMRYPVRTGERDSILLARETVWSTLGETGVVGHGQKMWASSTGDAALLDLRECEFHVGDAKTVDSSGSASA